MHHLADFKGLKIRVLASPFQNELISRLGGTPVAMTLGDVLPAIQQGTIDGTVSAMPVFTTMHYKDAAKYVIEIGQPFIFSVAEVSKKWFDTLPPDLQKIITDEGAEKRDRYRAVGRDVLRGSSARPGSPMAASSSSLPADEQATMMTRLAEHRRRHVEDAAGTQPLLQGAGRSGAAGQVTAAAARRLSVQLAKAWLIGQRRSFTWSKIDRGGRLPTKAGKTGSSP